MVEAGCLQRGSDDVDDLGRRVGDAFESGPGLGVQREHVGQIVHQSGIDGLLQRDLAYTVPVETIATGRAGQTGTQRTRGAQTLRTGSREVQRFTTVRADLRVFVGDRVGRAFAEHDLDDLGNDLIAFRDDNGVANANIECSDDCGIVQ